ncbi:MAG: hypothetical protein IJ501_05560 [Bacilli bacterium]|nr:hypothetical protein [Bacilli bacterium]
MENNNLRKMQEYKNLILGILEKYELCESYFVLSGLELVGYQNADFWLKVVEYIKRNKGIDELPNYLTLMKLVSHEDLLNCLKEIQNKDNFKNFEDSYLEFTSLLQTIKEVKKSR